MKNKKQDKYENMLTEFTEKIKRIEYLKYTLNSLIYWDKITYMPQKGIEYRSQVMSFLAEEMYKLLSETKLKSLLEYFDGNSLNNQTVNSMVRRIKRNNYYVSKIPEKEYGKYIYLIAGAEQVWENAKEGNQFSEFSPYLEKIIEHFKSFAKYWGYESNPYDALIGYYEDGVTTEGIDRLVCELRVFIIDLLGKIREKEKNEIIKKEKVAILSLEIEKQRDLSHWILENLGFDFHAGRLDDGGHPTTLANSPDDVRIVTAYNKEDVRTGIFNTLHEGGKGLYEQGIDKHLMGTLLAEVASFGVEEAVGRLYENIIGRSKGFSLCLCNKLKTISSDFEGLDADQLYESINSVQPSLVRIDADELTYTLHIIIRYELEKELISGDLTVRELPDAWNRKYREYLGIEPEHHREGVLQDIQWAAGYVGFFPSYFLANLMSAQIAAVMEKDIGSLESIISQGEFEKIHYWLSENIYKKGAVYSTAELIKEVTGGELSSKYYIEYLKSKYYEVYDL